jgi:hypothetical protein
MPRWNQSAPHAYPPSGDNNTAYVTTSGSDGYAGSKLPCSNDLGPDAHLQILLYLSSTPLSTYMVPHKRHETLIPIYFHLDLFLRRKAGVFDLPLICPVGESLTSLEEKEGAVAEPGGPEAMSTSPDGHF